MKSFKNNPLLSKLPQSTTPVQLFESLSGESPIISVKNPKKKKRFQGIDLEDQGITLRLKYYEYLAVSGLKNLNHKDTTKKETAKQQLNQVSQLLAKELGYTQESLKCFFDGISSDRNGLNVDSASIERCLNEKLSYLEQISVFLASKGVNAAIDNILTNPQFLQLLRSSNPVPLHAIPNQLPTHTEVEAFCKHMYEIVLPSNTLHGYIYQTLANWSDPRALLLKYIPLGMKYQRPSEKVKQFMNEHNLTQSQFQIAIATFLMQNYAAIAQ